MSLIEYGIANGFVEMGNDVLVIYPKRVINATVLKQTIQEAIQQDYENVEEMTFNKPIVMKKKRKLDLTELAVKLYALSGVYDVYLQIEALFDKEDGEVGIAFEYKGKSVEKRFDINMLCQMERDYLLGWLEEQLRKIDEETEDERK